jgi:polysaccharide export outer membrane protein
MSIFHRWRSSCGSGFNDWRTLALLAMLALAAGCTTYPPAPKDAGVGEYEYLIGALDTVHIIVWRNPDLSMVVPVRPDGKVTAPLIDDLQAQGKTPRALAQDIEKALAKYVREPVVTVVVTQFTGPASEQVRVIGEAVKPQILPYRKNMTLLDVMIAVGGLTPFADGNSATISRTAEGGKSYSVRLRDLVVRGDISANVEMRPGDIVVIPQSWF